MHALAAAADPSHAAGRSPIEDQEWELDWAGFGQDRGASQHGRGGRSVREGVGAWEGSKSANHLLALPRP